jgi:hypothetical protein
MKVLFMKVLLMKGLLLMIFALVATIAAAQTPMLTINIRYIDAISKKPLSNSEIELTNMKTKAVSYYTTNSSGTISLSQPAYTNYTIKTRYSPYAPMQLTCANSGANTRINVTHTDISSAAYREQQQADSLATIEAEEYQKEYARRVEQEKKDAIAKHKADSLARIEQYKNTVFASPAEKDKALNPEKYGTHFFYFVLDDERDGYIRIKVFNDKSKKIQYTTLDSYFKNETCMGSLKAYCQDSKIIEKAGTYTYYAVTADGKEEWSGTFSVSTNQDSKTAIISSKARAVKATK